MMAWLAIGLWPVVAAVFFRVLALPTALCATLIGGFLFLPTRTSFDLPVLPSIDKATVPAFAALVFTLVCLGSYPQALKGWLPRSRIALFFLALMLFGPLGTVLTNRDALVIAGVRHLPALSPYDFLALFSAALMALIPFFLGRKILATPQAQRSLLLVLIVAAVIYTLPTLFEVRMSPQLNRMIYGFFPHSWHQHVRLDGGYRPVVFLTHGLVLSLFMALATLAAFGMVRTVKAEQRLLFGAAGFLLFATLFLSKSLGAFIITVLLLPVCLFLRTRLQFLVAVSIAAIVLSYPVLRGADMIPIDRFVSVAQSISADRARSLEFRAINEDRLLDRFQERQVFGWGIWGRSRYYDERGRDVTVTDGEWIITLGKFGWVGYLGTFGLLGWGVIAMAFRRTEKPDPIAALLAILLTANIVDLIPNSGLTVITWLIAGALTGRLEISARTGEEAAQAVVRPSRGPIAYARTFPTKSATLSDHRRGLEHGYRRNFDLKDR